MRLFFREISTEILINDWAEIDIILISLSLISYNSSVRGLISKRLIILSSWYIFSLILVIISRKVCLCLVCLLNISLRLILLLFDLWDILTCLILWSLIPLFIECCCILSGTIKGFTYIRNSTFTWDCWIESLFVTWGNYIRGVANLCCCILSCIFNRATWIMSDTIRNWGRIQNSTVWGRTWIFRWLWLISIIWNIKKSIQNWVQISRCWIRSVIEIWTSGLSRLIINRAIPHGIDCEVT